MVQQAITLNLWHRLKRWARQFVFRILLWLLKWLKRPKNGTHFTKKIERETERLGLYLWQAPRTPLERQQNKETIELAKKIRYEKRARIVRGH